ncbi:hypothetical protein GJ744_011550 [Endocarpon pusillum]|uniref:Uncharacterized protein n=1 Tax=Endocarpon pusillum TaxID=364733 RepID=A0A8H7AD26_9EURO|nr:hypothetical protein GJ744_011550 [Endocarpon pusillum]
MTPAIRPSREEVYRRLKKGFNGLSGLFKIHLDDALLDEMGIDHVQIDLEQETQRGGPYFISMSQERMASFNKRPAFHVEYDKEWSSSVWSFGASVDVHREYQNQLYHSNDKSPWCELDNSSWQYQCRQGSYEMLLQEHYSPYDDRGPRCQSEWGLRNAFVAEGYPHRSCISLAGIPDIKGLTRNELMIVTGMMISTMRAKGNENVLVVPLVLVSIFGIYARIIQAHVALKESG